MGELETKPGGKYSYITIHDPEGNPKEWPEGMPIFVLLGQDALAHFGVDGYAAALEAHAEALERDGEGERAARFLAYAVDVRGFAARLREWQAANRELVKLPD